MNSRCLPPSKRANGSRSRRAASPSPWEALHREIEVCRACPAVAGTPVHGPAVRSSVLLVGQAPGPHEAAKGRPFAHTAGKTLFRWFEKASGITEDAFRERVYMAAVVRCFPGKAAGRGDRVPAAEEIARCRPFLAREVRILRPSLVIAVGNLAIREILGPDRYGPKARLVDVVGKRFPVRWLDHSVDAIALPHPSGASSWPHLEPGKTLLAKALSLIVSHAAWRETFC